MPSSLSVPRRPALGRRWGFWVAVMAACAASGLFYGALSGHGRPWIGAVYALFCGGGVMLFEGGVLAPALRDRLRGLPWLLGVAATEAVYLALVGLGTALAGLCLLATGALRASLREAVFIDPLTALYALAVLAVIVTLTRMRDLVGAEAFRNILVGRYHRPVEEERIFVFVDLVGSTAYALEHGDLRAQGYLGAIFAALAGPVRRFGGAIDDYVGDMAMITWRLDAGAREGRCVACVFAFLDAIAQDAEAWRRDFGEVPRFRAALHGGPVVTAEVGVDRHKISYFGDTVNTTGRIEALCRTLDAPILISSDLLDRLPSLPPGVRARSLGPQAVKGRGRTVSVLGLARGFAEDGAPVAAEAAAPRA